MWFHPSWAVTLCTAITLAKEKIGRAFEQTVPAKNWENEELMDKDRQRGMSEEQIMSNIKRGRYVLRVSYPEPHRRTDGITAGKIIIENCKLYKEDVRNYGAVQAQKWVKQGKYNLSPEELEIARLQYEKKQINFYAHATSAGMTTERKERLDEISQILKGVVSSKWDYHNTEAVKQWQKAHEASAIGSVRCKK